MRLRPIGTMPYRSLTAGLSKYLALQAFKIGEEW